MSRPRDVSRCYKCLYWDRSSGDFPDRVKSLEDWEGECRAGPPSIRKGSTRRMKYRIVKATKWCRLFGYDDKYEHPRVGPDPHAKEEAEADKA